MSIVYVVQNQHFNDRRTGQRRPKFDLTPAREYGELRYLLSPEASPSLPRSVIASLQYGLADFTERDYLLLLGNPCLIGWTVAVAAQKTGGPVKLLQWHNQSHSYILVEGNVFEQFGPCPPE